MQVTIQANGSPDEVRTAVANGIREARAGNEEGWPALRAIRDGLAMALDTAGPNDQVGVDVSISVVRVRRVDGEPMERGRDGFVVGESGVGVSTVSAVPAVDGAKYAQGSGAAVPSVVERRGSGKRTDR